VEGRPRSFRMEESIENEALDNPTEVVLRQAQDEGARQQNGAAGGICPGYREQRVTSAFRRLAALRRRQSKRRVRGIVEIARDKIRRHAGAPIIVREGFRS
ncbi:MAG: hypothetical protein ACLPN5_09815, partial [Roseiarcus sp.]